MNNKIIALLYGILVDIVDDINDYNVGVKYKEFMETALILLTIYILFFNRDLGIPASFIFTFGGIIGLLFAPHIVDANIWKITIFLAILAFFSYMRENLHFINKKDIENFKRMIVPVSILATILSLIEDKFIPEEVSMLKLYDRIFQVAVVILFINYADTLMTNINLSKIQKNGLQWAAWGWLGYAGTSVASLLYFLFFSD